MKKFYFLLFIGLAFSSALFAQKKQDNPRVPAQVKELRTYPNPATSEINFEFPEEFDENQMLEIYNFLGKKVFHLPKVNKKNTVNLSNFFRGLYIFQVKDKNGRIVQSGKFQVIK